MAKDSKIDPATRPTERTATAPAASTPATSTPASSSVPPEQVPPLSEAEARIRAELEAKIRAEQSLAGQGKAEVQGREFGNGGTPASLGDRQPTGQDLRASSPEFGKVPEGARTRIGAPARTEPFIPPEREAQLRREIRDEVLQELQDRLEGSELARVVRDLLAPRGPEVVPGKKTYVLTQRHYRGGKMYEPGDRITVVDEAPGRTWVPLEVHLRKQEEERAAAEEPAPDILPGRRAQLPNDEDV